MTTLESDRSVVDGLAAVEAAIADAGLPGDALASSAWLALALAVLDEREPEWLEPLTRRLEGAVDVGLAAARKFPVHEWLTSGVLAAEFKRHLAQTDEGEIDDRRNAGAYFTPSPLIRLLVSRALSPLLDSAKSVDDVLGLRVLDPSVGAGGFLLEAARQLSVKVRSMTGCSAVEAKLTVVRHCLYGVDANPLAVLLTAAALGSFAGDVDAAIGVVQWADFVLPQSLVDVTDRPAAKPLDTRHWFRDAPAKFDLIIGNPPWGAVKPALREFLATAEPALLRAQGAELRKLVRQRVDHLERWESHAEEVRSYAKALRSQGWYQHQGRGDADFYRYFVERAHQLACEDRGRIGMLLPAAILRADGAAPLRSLLLQSGTIEEVVEFTNTDRIFEIHSMFRFVMLLWSRGEPNGVRRATFGAKRVEDVSEATAIEMPIELLRSVGGGRFTVPDVRSRRDVQLLTGLYESHPLLGDSTRQRRIRFVRELDMTNDSALFVHAHDVTADGDSVPLYEGRMVHQFDDRAKCYVEGAGRRAVWIAQGLGERRLQPHFYVPQEVARRASPGHDRAGFCDVTGHANERTILAAMVPASAAAGNKVPTMRFDPDGGRRDHLVWLAYANSFVLDWVARRRVQTSLNFFHLEQLPLPEIDCDDPAGARLVELASALSDTAAEWTLETLRARARGRAELDAHVAMSFGLRVEDFAHVLTDFPLLDRHQPGGLASRSTITRDLVLLEYARLNGESSVGTQELGWRTDDGPVDLAERVAVALDAGQIAYVPGELAKAIWRPPVLV